MRLGPGDGYCSGSGSGACRNGSVPGGVVEGGMGSRRERSLSTGSSFLTVGSLSRRT